LLISAAIRAAYLHPEFRGAYDFLRFRAVFGAVFDAKDETSHTRCGASDPFLATLCNYIPLAEAGQNTRRAAMRKWQAFAAWPFTTVGHFASSFTGSLASLLPGSFFSSPLTSLLRLMAN
jgi:hypothetical protein